MVAKNQPEINLQQLAARVKHLPGSQEILELGRIANTERRRLWPAPLTKTYVLTDDRGVDHAMYFVEKRTAEALRCAGLLTGDYLSDGLTITQTGLDVLRVLENEEETHDR